MLIREVHDEDLEAYFMHQLDPEALGSIRVLEKCGFRRLPVDVRAPASNAGDGIEEAVLVLETPWRAKVASVASNLECVGLAVEDRTGLQRLVMDALTSAQRLGERDGITVLRWQDLSGARLVMGMRDGKLLDLLPSFAGTPGVRLANVHAANDDVAIADVLDERGEQLTMLAVELEQRRFLSPVEQAAGRASVVALGVDVTIHADADAFSNSDASFLGNADDATDDPPANAAEQGLVWPPRMAAESLISYGVFGDPAQAEAYARINGTVLHAARRTVATTGHQFIVARISALGFELDMCLPGTLAPVPEPGNVIGGTAFVVASLPAIAPHDIS